MDDAPSPRCAPDLAHRVAHHRVVTHRHREHLGQHAADNSGGAAAEIDTGQCLIDHTRPGLGQSQATQARVDDPRQRRLVPGQGLHRHHAVVLPETFAGRRSSSLLETAPHPVLPQLLHGHVRLGSTKAQRAPFGQSLLQGHLGLAAPGAARLDQAPAAVEVAHPHSGQPLFSGATNDRTYPAHSVLTHRRPTAQRVILLAYDDPA